MTTESTTTQRLHLEDLAAALADERHLGWGYATAYDLSARKRERLDRCVIAVANELALDYEALFHWTNSKYGRWLVDESSGCEPTQKIVRRLLNEESVRIAMEAS